MDEELTESEREQLRKIAILQKISFGILRKWAWLLLLIFGALLTAGTVLLVWRTARSVHRFEASTRLLYNPRQVARIENVSDKQLLSILERRSLKRKVGNRLPMGDMERMCLTIDLGIVQERKPSNLYTLTAAAPSWIGAVKKVNAYAELLVEEYVAYRTRDLDNWRGSLEVRKKNLQRQITELEVEEQETKGKAGVVAPAETLAMVNGLLSDQRRNLSGLNVQMSNENLKRKKLETQVGSIGKIVMENAGVIRQKSAAIVALDKEIAVLRESYTDLNPRVSGKLEDRKALLGEYAAFLKEKGIDGLDVSSVDEIEKAASELAETLLRIDVLKENIRSVEQEIAGNETRSKELTAAIPAFERLRVRRTDLEQTLRELDDQLENIAYLEMSVANDLRQIERAGGADDMDPFRLKNFVLAAFVALFLTLFAATVIVVVELRTGKMRDGRELAAHDDVLTYLGALPAVGALDEAETKDVQGVVALKFVGADLPKGVVLICRLPGSEPQIDYWNALDWSLSMAGESSVALNVVPGAGFAPPEGSEALIGGCRKGNEAWFPVENRYVLAPTELQMLQADIAALRERSDHVFVLMPDGVRRGGSFFDQLLSVCDSVVVTAGAGKTDRTWLVWALAHVKAARKPAFGLATGAAARSVRREMEAGR